MLCKLYKLRFNAPLHLGDNRDDYGTSLRTIHSDSFYAAVTAILAKQGIDIPEDGDLGFTTTALFPFYQKENSAPETLFFPFPKLPGILRLKDVSLNKKLKSVQWVDSEYLQNILGGETEIIEESALNRMRNGFLTRREIDYDFICSNVVERVSVSRVFKDSTPFFMERISFSAQSGLFFLAEGDTALLDRALPLLALEGIGTDRNVGNGTFDFEVGTVRLALPENSDYAYLLSTFIPESREQLTGMLSGDMVSYEIIRRGGWITTPPHMTLRKNAIYGFLPGSILNGLNTGDGHIVNLAPDGLVNHPVWRCGKAFVLPLKSIKQ